MSLSKALWDLPLSRDLFFLLVFAKNSSNNGQTIL